MMKPVYLLPLKLCSLLLMLSLCTGCPRNKDTSQEKLKREIESIDEITLLEGDLKGYLQYDKDKNEVLFTLKADRAVDMMQNVDKQLANDYLRIVLSDEDGQLVSLMADAGAGCTAYCTDGERTIQIAHLTQEDVKAILQHPIPDAERKEMLLKNYVSKIESALPQKVDDGIVYRHIEIEDEDIVQQYIIDENLYNLEEVEQDMIKYKYDMVTDPLQRNEYDIYVSHGKGLRMEFYTDNTKPVMRFSIHYTSDELKMTL